MVQRRDITAWVTRSIPIGLVALLWAGVWKLWPEPQPYVWRPERKPMKISFVTDPADPAPQVDPTLFAFDSAVSYRAAETGKLELLRMPGMPGGGDMFLEMNGQVLESRTDGKAMSYSAWSKKPDGYSGAWSEKGVFEEGKVTRQLVLIISDNLKSASYTVPVPEEKELEGLPAGWQVTAALDIDKSGVPGHVLVEKSSGNKDIDALVCRKILLGRADQREVKGGRVTISYGLE